MGRGGGQAREEQCETSRQILPQADELEKRVSAQAKDAESDFLKPSMPGVSWEESVCHQIHTPHFKGHCSMVPQP